MRRMRHSHAFDRDIELESNEVSPSYEFESNDYENVKYDNLIIINNINTNLDRDSSASSPDSDHAPGVTSTFVPCKLIQYSIEHEL